MRAPRTPAKQKGFWNFIIPAVAALAGSAMSSKGQRDTNQANANLSHEQNVWNAQQAAQARDFEAQQVLNQQAYQTQMANTSYQRAVGDMRAAGLNPMLGYSQGGAPSPQGAAASGNVAQGATPIPMGNELAGFASTAMNVLQLQNTAKQGENIDADTELKKRQGERETASAGESVQRSQSLYEGIRKMAAELENIAADTTNKTKQKTLIEAQTRLAHVQMELELKRIPHTEALTRVEQIRKDLLQQEITINKPAADFATSDVGEDKPLIKLLMDLGKLIQSGRK